MSRNDLKIPAALIVVFLMGYGALQAQVGNNGHCINKLQETPIQIAKLEQKVEDMDKSLTEFKGETKQEFVNVENKLDKIVDILSSR